MIETERSRGQTRHLAAVPLAIAYLLLPVVGGWLPGGMRLGSGMGLPLQHAVWTVLSASACLWAVWVQVRSGPGFSDPLAGKYRLWAPLVLATLACLLFGAAWVWAGPRVEPAETALRWLAELGPLVYLLLALLWAWRFGLPGRDHFLHLGGALGALTLLDAGLALALSGHAALRTWMDQGVLLHGGGEAVACLLVLALFAATREEGEPKVELFDSRIGLWAWRGCRWMVVLGLAATLSRTALFAAACGWLFLGTGGRLRRFALVLFFLGCVVLSFRVVPPATADADWLRGGLLWMAGMERFSATPEALMTARGLGPFALSLPLSVASALGLPGKVHLLFPGEITSLWLRLTLVWSGIGAALFGLLLLVPVVMRPSRFGAGVIALILAQGTVYGLFYDPLVSVALWLALLVGLARSQEGRPERETAFDEREFSLE